jgi:hypothetical protein
MKELLDESPFLRGYQPDWEEYFMTKISKSFRELINAKEFKFSDAQIIEVYLNSFSFILFINC